VKADQKARGRYPRASSAMGGVAGVLEGRRCIKPARI
jgi:hypothetical protein